MLVFLGLHDYGQVCRVGWGKISTVEQSSSLGIFICLPKIREPMVIRSTFYFPVGIGKAKLNDHPVIISSLTVTPEMEPSLDSFMHKFQITDYVLLIIWKGKRPDDPETYLCVLPYLLGSTVHTSKIKPS